MTRASVIPNAGEESLVTTYEYGTTGCDTCSGGISSQPTKITYPGGMIKTFEYDVMGRKTKETIIPSTGSVIPSTGSVIPSGSEESLCHDPGRSDFERLKEW